MITNEVVKSFPICKYKAYLKFYQQLGNKTNEYRQLEQEIITIYRLRFYKQLQNRYDTSYILQEIPLEWERYITQAVIVNPYFQSKEYIIDFEAIELIPNKGSPKKIFFVPIDITFKEGISKTEKLSLAIKCLLISQLQNFPIEYGKIIHGENLKGTKIDLADYSQEAKKAVRELKKVINADSAPCFYQNSHCKICEFQESCRAKLIEKDDLSLLRGMGQKEILKKHKKGIFTINQLSYTFRPKRQSLYLHKNRQCLWSLKALALREKQTYIREIPEIPTTEANIYLDIEGLPEEDFYYLIGLLIETNNREQTFSFWADSREDEENIFKQFFDILSAFNDFTIYHYGNYEIKSLKKM